ncbi:FxSxx-COOH system tetratricopeptide repeat protein [Streptomyces avermitilis]|uniref:FxSxx-COOH system tetratricopeptide repeat protein n=1 Tax=Streptomyces avermitilis TaxID=33903 RepID=UPI0036CE6DEA
MNPVNPDDHPLLIEPVVAWPRLAETECEYLVSVDLRGPLPEGISTWPYPDEEFTFTLTLDGSPYFVCTALDEPSVVLHRFGGTYGPAYFRVSTAGATGSAALWLTVSNQWGVPVRKAELRSQISERPPGGAPAATLAKVMRELASSAERPAGPRTPEWSGLVPGAGERGADGPRTGAAFPPTGSSPGQRPPRRRLRTGRQTITISFTSSDRAWADWIGYRLERRGHRVVHQRWDPPPGAALPESLRDLLLAPGPVLLVLSDQYFRWGTRTHAEWCAALSEVVTPNAERIALVSVAPTALSAAVTDALPLYDVGPQEAERRLLDRLDLPADTPPESAEGPRNGPAFPIHTLRVWGRVPERNERFTGRVPLLNKAYELLQSAGTVILCGTSGVGKTQLAAEYAHRFASGYQLVWWVNAGSQATLRQGLAELAPALGLPTGAAHGERLRAVGDALRRGDPYPRWLLILDGADDPDQVRDLVPTGPGRVLITSSDPQWGSHNGALVQVPPYDRNESVAFIRRRAPRLTEEDAHRLAEALEDLPLLLDQTAGWLEESGMPVAEYLELLTRDPGRSGPIDVSSGFPRAVRSAWAVLLDKFRTASPEAVQLLRLCTFFAPDAVPVRLLREMPADGLSPAVARLLTDAHVWDRAIDQLHRYAVVRVEHQGQDPSSEVLSMHRIVHELVRDDMSDEDYEGFAEAARRALAAGDPGGPANVDSWPRYASLVPHLDYADVLSHSDPAVHQLVLHCLRYLYLSGEYGTGIRLAQQALSAVQGLQDDHSELLWDLGHHYANLLRAVGDYRHSEAVSRAAVEEHRAVGGPRSVRYLRAVGSLAADLRALGRYEEALGLSEEVCQEYQELEGGTGPRTLTAQNNLAVSLRLLGRYVDALDIDRRTLDLRRRDQPVWALSSEISCATDLRLLGAYPEAERLQASSLERHREVLGDDHPRTLHAAYNLAQCQYRTGGHEAAGARFATVLARSERVSGEDDPQTLMFAVALCCHAREHGDIDRARGLSESVVGRYEHLLGRAHPYAAGARANHALILRVVGERRQAHVLAEQALADMARAVGPSHPWTLGCAVNAAATRGLTDRLEPAAELSRDTASRAAATLGRTHPLTLSACVSLAADLRALGRAEEAERMEAGALADLSSTLGAHHVHTAAARARTRPYWDFEPQTT